MISFTPIQSQFEVGVNMYIFKLKKGNYKNNYNTKIFPKPYFLDSGTFCQT